MKRLLRIRTSALLASLLAAMPVLATTPLIDAINAHDNDAALTLLQQGADPVEAETNGTTALHWAAHHGQHAVIAALLKAGADPQVRNAFGSSPLSEAVFNGDLEAAQLLLDAGADANEHNPQGQTLLMTVARTDNLALASLLLERGADVNAREVLANQSALMWAVAQQQPQMARLLITHGADVDAQSLVQDRDRRVTSEPRVKYQSTGGFTPLLFAARQGCMACTELLLDAGADIDKRDPDGTTALNLSIQNGHFDLARFLIGKGANVNYWDWWGRGPLYSAVDMNTLPAGGRAELPSLSQATALELIELLLERDANPNLQLKFLVPFRSVGSDRGGDLVLNTGATPLLRAAKAGDVPAVRLLLEHGADTELHTYANHLDWASGTRPLSVAAGLSYQLNDTRGQAKTQDMAIATIDLLLEYGADINARDDRGRTAVHGAVFRGWDQVLTHLAARGADLQIADINGVTPLDAAMGKAQVLSRETITISPTTAPLLAALLEQQ